MSDKEVSFYSNGLRLAGTLSTPNNGPMRTPAVVICHGFASIRHIHPPSISAELVAKGFATLSLDFRGFGESEGRRGVLKPMEQVEDIISAVSFVSQIPSIDKDRIGLIGVSFGGSEGVVAAALDSRIRCVVSVVAVGDTKRWLRGLRSFWEWKELLGKADEDRTKRVLNGESLQAEIPDFLNMKPSLRADFRKRVEQFPSWSLKLSLESLDSLLLFRPEDYVNRIAPRAVLFVTVTDDDVVDPEESKMMYEKALEPKKLMRLEGQHYDVYRGELLKQIIEHSCNWFSTYM